MKISTYILEPVEFDVEKFKAVCNKTDQQIEKLSKIGYSVMAKLTPWIWIWPKVITSYFIYFTTDLDSDSFILPVLLVSVEVLK